MKPHLISNFTKVVIFFFIISSALGQTEKIIPSSNQIIGFDSIYLFALKKYIHEVDNYNKISELNTIYVEHQNFLVDFPKEINGHEIVVFNPFIYKKVFKKHNNEIRLVRIFPLTLEDKKFKISIVPYFAHLNRKRLNLELSNWTIIYFRFSEGHLIFDKVENGGI